MFLRTASAGADGFDAQRWVPSAGGDGEFVVESPAVLSHLGFGIGLFSSFGDDPVVERDGGMLVSRPLDSALTADLVASIGFFDRAELGLHLPVHMVYDGDDYAAGSTMLSAGGGVGDVGIHPKVELWGAGDAEQHVLFGVSSPMTIPAGDDEALRGAGGFTVEPRLLALAQLGRFGITANGGYRWRSEAPEDLPWGDEIALSLALSYELLPRVVEARAEVFGGKQLADGGGPDFPVEALLGAVYRPAERWRVYGAAGPGLSDGLGSPDLRVVLGVRYVAGARERDGFGDRDGDGIADRDDDCPDDAEDLDAFEDGDGCPEADNDRDQILDVDDECPDMPEEPGGDGDGCPSETYVEIEEGQLQIFGKVQFETGSDAIQQKSEPLVDQIAAALRANPNVGRVRIEGHTDNVGGEKMNRQLSKKRAKSVKRALVERGVPEDRLEIQGYGESRPIAPNQTAAGRAKNRRVGFVLID